jgi:rubrerythrin
MELFRCRICGEVYFGKHPTHCPYCGAHALYLVPISEWTDENLGLELTVEEKANLKTTLDLEYENTRFYRAAAMVAKTDELKGFFKYLSKIENEHYNVAAKLLWAEKDSSIFEPSTEMGSDVANIKHSREKEEHASKLYATFIPESKNERLKTFFSALSEVEADHIDLDDKELLQIK